MRIMKNWEIVEEAKRLVDEVFMEDVEWKNEGYARNFWALVLTCSEENISACEKLIAICRRILARRERRRARETYV